MSGFSFFSLRTVYAGFCNVVCRRFVLHRTIDVSHAIPSPITRSFVCDCSTSVSCKSTVVDNAHVNCTHTAAVLSFHRRLCVHLRSVVNAAVAENAIYNCSSVPFKALNLLRPLSLSSLRQLKRPKSVLQ